LCCILTGGKSRKKIKHQCLDDDDDDDDDDNDDYDLPIVKVLQSTESFYQQHKDEVFVSYFISYWLFYLSLHYK